MHKRGGGPFLIAQGRGGIILIAQKTFVQGVTPPLLCNDFLGGDAEYIMAGYTTAGYVKAGYITPGCIKQGIQRHVGNGNSHISTPRRRKCLFTIAFESPRRALRHCQSTSYLIDKNDIHIYIYIYIYMHIYIHTHIERERDGLINQESMNESMNQLTNKSVNQSIN